MKIAVFSALFGGEPLRMHRPKFVNHSIDYHYFTDDMDARSPTWNIHRTPIEKSARYTSRSIKMNFPKRYPGYDWTIWMDSRYTSISDPAKLVLELEEEGAELAAFKHHARDNIIDEAAAILRSKKAAKADIDNQLATYLADGFGADMEKLSLGGFLVRKNTLKVQEFNLLWFSEVEKHTLRDQMSLDYCAWKLGLDVKHLDGTQKKNAFAKWKVERV